jgi:predicted secreted hydrolase
MIRRPAIIHNLTAGLRAAGLVTALVTVQAAAESISQPQTGFRFAAPGLTLQFPRDHGSHDDFRTEWWYYTGHLTVANGRQFGYQLTFFRQGVDRESVRSNPSRWAIRHLYLAHLALSDLDQGRFRYAEKISRAGVGKAGADTGRLRVWIDRWTVESGSSPPHRHHLKAAGEDFSIDLELAPEKSVVTHGERGLSRKGPEPNQASHYYSLTRLATTGTVSVDGATLAVGGTSWMDHEFGSGDLGNDQVGWDWFSVQLADRTEFMFYLLRRADGTVDPVSSGTWISPDGQARPLSLSDVAIGALDHWTSPASGATYPSRWKITVPSSDLVLTLTPRLAGQELMTPRSTRITYWEGAVQASGTSGGIPIAGLGYVELTGYAERFRQKL